MYWKPQQPNNNPSNPFFHPLNQKLNEVKATARNIVKGLGDADGPFTVVAIKRDKVIKQETTKRRDMLPAIVSTMRKEVGSGVTIAVEDKKGTIRSTFKESVNEERQFKARIAFMGKPEHNARDMRAAARMGMYDAATERNVPSKRKSTVFDITFKSERQFSQFMGAYNVEFLERLDEGVQLDEKKKPISTRLSAAWGSGELEDRIKDMSGPARKSFMNLANSLVDFDHSMRDIHQVDGRQLEDKIDASPPRVRKMFAKLLDEEVTRLKEPHRVQKKKQTRKAKPIKDDVQIDEATPGDTRVVTKGDQNQYERISRALTAAKKAGKIAGYEGTVFNRSKGEVTLIFDTKAHKPASERRKVAKMIKDFGLEFHHSIEEGLRQAMSGPRETSAQRQKRQEKDNFDLYKKRQKRIAALRGDKSSRRLTPKQERDYKQRVNLDAIKAFEETIMEGAKFSSAQLNRLKKEYAKIGRVDPEKPTYKKLTDMLDKMTDEQLKQIEKANIKFMSSLAANRLNNRNVKKEGVMEAKGTYSSMGRRGVDKPLLAYIDDLEDELKKMGMKYSDKRVNPDDVMKAYNANMSPKDAAKMIKKKG
jgi:hypothetical protein